MRKVVKRDNSDRCPIVVPSKDAPLLEFIHRLTCSCRLSRMGVLSRVGDPSSPLVDAGAPSSAVTPSPIVSSRVACNSQSSDGLRMGGGRPISQPSTPAAPSPLPTPSTCSTASSRTPSCSPSALSPPSPPSASTSSDSESLPLSPSPASSEPTAESSVTADVCCPPPNTWLIRGGSVNAKGPGEMMSCGGSVTC